MEYNTNNNTYDSIAKSTTHCGLKLRGFNPRGFALIEVLIAMTILSIALIGIISGVSGGIIAIAQSKNLTKAMIIAKNSLNEFEMNNMRGSDVKDEEVREYTGFSYSRETKRFEHELLGPLEAKRVEITVKWLEKGRDKSYSVSYVFPSR
jgi:type II secretion system protein I